MSVEKAIEHVRGLLDWLGDDSSREGLEETPKRVLKSYQQLYSGYGDEAADVFKTFKDGACDEMVLLKNVEFYSMCEHHMLPFFGKAHIAYLPDGKVVGISKLARLLEVFSRRLQIQERLTTQITDAIVEHLSPSCACVLEATHFCMVARGVKKQNSILVTSSLQGAFKNVEVRQEFFNLIKG